jgi:hypothetical protein
VFFFGGYENSNLLSVANPDYGFEIAFRELQEENRVYLLWPHNPDASRCTFSQNADGTISPSAGPAHGASELVLGFGKAYQPQHGLFGADSDPDSAILVQPGDPRQFFVAEPVAGNEGDDSCEYAFDGECDVSSGYCAAGTDCTDCGDCSDARRMPFCEPGVRGRGGDCDCTLNPLYDEFMNGAGSVHGPFCHEGACYMGQEGCDNIREGDGSWCWDGNRDTFCPLHPPDGGPPEFDMTPFCHADMEVEISVGDAVGKKWSGAVPYDIAGTYDVIKYSNNGGYHENVEFVEVVEITFQNDFEFHHNGDVLMHANYTGVGTRTGAREWWVPHSHTHHAVTVPTGFELVDYYGQYEGWPKFGDVYPDGNIVFKNEGSSYETVLVFQSDGSKLTLPRDLSSPGSIRVPCPKGMKGSVVLVCTDGELQVALETCEPMPAGVCEAVGLVCGDPAACTDTLPASRCAAAQRRGRCDVPQFATGCCSTCGSDGL